MLRTFLVGCMILACGTQVSLIAADSSLPPPQLPDTTPPGKPHFDNKGAMVGDQLPNFPMCSLDGKKLSLEKAWVDGTTLLLTSSYTCPKSRATYPHAAELATRVSSHGIHAAIIYIIEAHPAGDPSPYTGKEEVTEENRRDKILCRQPTTMENRLKLANDFSVKLKVDLPIYVDEMDNAAWATLGGGPNMGVLVDKNGIVLARQGWFDARSMESAIDVFIARAPKPPATQPDEASNDEDSTLRDLIVHDKTDAVKALLAGKPELEHHMLDCYPDKGSLLQVAAEYGQSQVIKLLVERGADVNAHSDVVPSPLQLLAARGSPQSAEILIAHGADVNARALGYGPTPLQIALCAKNTKMAAALIKAGAKPNFYTAAATGDLAAFQAAFLHDPTILMRPDGFGRDALGYAVGAEQLEAAKLLVSLGARDLGPSRRDYDPDRGWPNSAMILAVRQTNLGLTRLLLDHGSDPNRLDIAIGVDIPADFVRTMLDHKANASFSQPDELQPILRAVLDGRRDIVQMLLDAGADINTASNVSNMMFCGGTYSKGDTTLHVAIENSHSDMVEFLIAHGAKVNARNDDGTAPLDIAAGDGEDGAAQLVRLLIAHHADVNAAGKTGRTAMHWAADNRGENAAQVMAILLENHAKVNVADANGVTPLHLAASNDGKDALAIARLLIENHADINAADMGGLTTLDYAGRPHTNLFGAENGDPAPMIELLKMHGAVNGKPAAP